jgi:predicted N-acetyltransferase YhbS
MIGLPNGVTETLLPIRRARPADAAALERLIERSFRAFGPAHYGVRVTEAALGRLIRLDRELIADRSFFAVECAGALIACGGYSERLSAVPGDDLDGEPEMRAMFVAPEHGGRGVGSALLRHIEAELVVLGHTRSRLQATLSGVGFYRRLGYRALERREPALPDGMRFPVVAMVRKLVR